MTQDMKTIVIDNDTGIDDSVAILAAKKLGIGLDYVVSTACNTSVHNALVNNTLLRRYYDMSYKTVAGLDVTIDGKTKSRSNFHGTDGFGENQTALARHLDIDIHGIKADYDLDEFKQILGTLDNITYITTGSLSSLAYLIEDENIHIDKIYSMGGAIMNFTREHDSETNFLSDGLAVMKILDSNIDWTIFPSDFTYKQLIDLEFLDNLKDYEYEYIRKNLYFYANKLAKFGLKGVIIHDMYPIIYAASPSSFEYVDCRLLANEYGHLEENENGRLVHVANKINEDFIKKILN